MEKPYNDIDDVTSGHFIRNFGVRLSGNELVWHRDKKDRIVEVLEGENWRFQYDNSLPFELKIGDIICVPAETYHRLLKGTTALSLKIKEL